MNNYKSFSLAQDILLSLILGRFDLRGSHRQTAPEKYPVHEDAD